MHVLLQVTTAIAEKTVRLLKSAIAVVSAKAVVACIERAKIGDFDEKKLRRRSNT